MLDLRYELEDAGWATSHFKWDGGSLDFRTSFLSNPLGELAELARWLVDPTYRERNEWREVVNFTDEPGSLVLTVELGLDFPYDADAFELWKEETILLKLEEWEDLSPTHPEPDTFHISTTMTVSDFVSMVFRELNDVWQEYGMVGYDRRWISWDFPVTEYAVIGHYLNAPRPTQALWGPLSPPGEEADV